MINQYFLAKLENYEKLHSLIIEDAKAMSRGVFVFLIEQNELSGRCKLHAVQHCVISDFQMKSENNSQRLQNEAIIQSIRHYDINYQYCALFEINLVIVGGCFIPFDAPHELAVAIDRAIAEYNSP